jgi:CBS-domain-containing membrane protein
MMASPKTFFARTAGDLMSRRVVAIPQGMSLRAAAGLLAKERISGAPVVDETGRCVGVLSASDFVKWAQDGGPEKGVRFTAAQCFCSEWQVVDLTFLPPDEVRWHMTADPVMVSLATPITDLARMMVDAHIHRLIVVDAEHRPIGVVSSTDILAALADADSRNAGAPAGQRWDTAHV